MDKLRMHSVNKVNEHIEKITTLFPNCKTEVIKGHREDGTPIIEYAIDFDILRQELSDVVVEGPVERYQFTWPEKRKIILAANAPITKTLRPCREESVEFDTTENLYIEGDNLDALKLLQETYLSKVKMIYIDPPYNTGNDFVYEDDFSESVEKYMERSGNYDEEGNRLVKNTETNGRFHTDWLNMIYPRLKLARNLLRDDGVVFISIDDAEQENLKKLCDEVFGAKNFVACLIYDKNRKNDARYFSVGHEYLLVYFKNAQTIYDQGVIFRAPKEGVDEVRIEFERLKKLHGDNWDEVGKGIKELYSSWSNDDDRKPLARFTKVDEKGPYRDDGNISWPGGGGPKYEVLHPVTNKPCKIPDAGWRFPNPKRMKEEIDSGRVVFGPDETTLPRIRRNLFESDSQVMRSVHFSYAQTATVEFNKLFANVRVFDNPKSVDDIKRLIAYITEINDDSIILDFFSGSATTAHATMQLNAEDGGNRRFIMVQLPEETDEKSEAFKAGFKAICEIGKERIRRAAKKIRQENPDAKFDGGFRTLKVDSSNMEDVYYNPTEYQQVKLWTLADNIKPDRTPEDLLFQVMLDLGVLLSSKIEEISIGFKKVFSVADGYLLACFDDNVTDEVVTEIAKRKPYYYVMRDSSLATDSTAINFEQIFATYSPTTIRKVL
ncbi:site-specific DNA-methyltransferase [Paenibacillus chitinolyticus]|uniref:site-specific DNA-methyltransferase n=1 Tax=Paenibacillus chitinolyticus TaxID=79263 RepID=UPI0035DDEBBD